MEWFRQDSIDDLIRWPVDDLPSDHIKRTVELLAAGLIEAARAIHTDE